MFHPTMHKQPQCPRKPPQSKTPLQLKSLDGTVPGLTRAPIQVIIVAPSEGNCNTPGWLLLRRMAVLYCASKGRSHTSHVVYYLRVSPPPHNTIQALDCIITQHT